MGRTCTTVVVGGGCSGALAAIHLSRDPRHAVMIVDPTPYGELGRGVAYSTRHPAHLLNSRAAAMSARADRPDDFVRWCRDQDLGIGPADFAPRGVYGGYLHDRLTRARFTHVRAAATRVHADGAVTLSDGTTIRGDRVLLALGHGAPTALTRFQDHPRYVANPWDPEALDGLEGDLPVLLVGTGLTAVDVAIALEGRVPVVAYSRRGLLPRPHADVVPADRAFEYQGRDLAGLMRAVREFAATQPDWRSAVDALRPEVDRLWRGLTPEARRRFLRHVSTYWEVHRHRMPPASAARLRTLRTTTSSRGEWAAVINCTGPQGAAVTEVGRHLLDDGLARLDPTGKGLDVDEAGRLHDRIYTIGPVRRGAWWETTAVPEIRRQADRLSRDLLEGHDVLDEGDQDVLDRAPVARVAQDDRHVRIEVQGLGDLRGAVLLHPVEAVHRDQERRGAALEVVHRREAVVQAAGVGQHHRAERAQRQLVPQEPEAVLAGRAEQIQHDVLVDADPAEVHGHGRRRLALDPVDVVDADAGVGEHLLRLQRSDLAHRADERGLADAEPTRDEDLHREGNVTVRALGGH
ncbi:hypothetical protein GCM10018962_23160 [Dactylosporangium matsuzakiense]|uniref:FAD-dependent urate hydroxylase HpyO/Asp monooxygenase CreE-like FAD/NAD(P)-binding domain-containing protein n=1 Tax=Dactylosporangium matsuzakiense TaxID=53360 RepID=A0A9W6KME1_9ACTN|nr:hypothetical protein GCM10017581_049580 [Dactylosporangium matsuzakiense]